MSVKTTSDGAVGDGSTHRPRGDFTRGLKCPVGKALVREAFGRGALLGLSWKKSYSPDPICWSTCRVADCVGHTGWSIQQPLLPLGGTETGLVTAAFRGRAACDVDSTQCRSFVRAHSPESWAMPVVQIGGGPGHPSLRVGCGQLQSGGDSCSPSILGAQVFLQSLGTKVLPTAHHDLLASPGRRGGPGPPGPAVSLAQPGCPTQVPTEGVSGCQSSAERQEALCSVFKGTLAV